MATEKQVEAARGKVEDLRQQIANLNAERETDERAALNDITLTQLKAEESALKSELEYAKRLKTARAKGSRAATEDIEDATSSTAAGTTIQTAIDRGAEGVADAVATAEKGN